MTTPQHAAERTAVHRRGRAPARPLSGPLWIVHRSAIHWTVLGGMLLAATSLAVWMARNDPLAISGIWIADAAILGAVPSIMHQRTRHLDTARRAADRSDNPDGDIVPEAELSRDERSH
jgi:hypothetical protein